MDLKSGPVNLHIRPAREIKTAVLVVGFKAAGEQALISSISCPGGIKAGKAHETAVLYAMFLNCRDKVHKNFAEETRSKVINFGCGLQNDEFNIYAELDGSLTTIRKTLKAILGGLNPAKVRSVYKSTVRTMDVAPNEDAFDATTHSLLSGLKNVHVVITGKVPPKKDELQKVLDAAVEKFDPQAAADKGAAKSAEGNSTSPAFADQFISSKAGSPDAVVAGYMYLINNFPGVSVIDRKLCVFASQRTAFEKIGDKKELVQKQLEKLELLEEPSHSLAAVAIRHHLLSVSDILELADTKVSPAKLAGDVVKLF